MQTPIRVFSRECELLGQVESYDSFVFTRRNDSFGEFTICVNSSLPGAELFELGNMIYLDGERAGFIEALETVVEADGDACETTTVTGRTLEYMLTYRIIMPVALALPMPAETLIKLLVSRNLGVEAGEARRVTNLEIVETRGEGDEVSWEWGYKNLAEEVSALCKRMGLGVRITLDLPRKTFVFDVTSGVDRSIEQNEMPPVIISTEFDNVFEQTYIENRLSEKNTALAAGAGEGEAQETLWVNGENTGLERREVYTENKTIEAGNKAKLTELGKNAVADALPILTLDSELNPYHTFAIGRDFFLGDLVTLRWRQVGLCKRVMEVSESWDENGYGVSCIFGQKAPSLLDRINTNL